MWGTGRPSSASSHPWAQAVVHALIRLGEWREEGGGGRGEEEKGRREGGGGGRGEGKVCVGLTPLTRPTGPYKSPHLPTPAGPAAPNPR